MKRTPDRGRTVEMAIAGTALLLSLLAFFLGSAGITVVGLVGSGVSLGVIIGAVSSSQ